ncbi:isochorismatase family protein [Aquimarina macrocephali]|uniref:isochorismatase family protein n=1 Tax=Aquimarina macrocephali TaxID=666563 RepID=UPI0004651FB9|nr:isochorismatase family protein [Aquimarina macrocephali]
MKNRKALLIIDMQKGSFTPKTPRFDAKGVVNRINTLAQLFRASDFSVFFIQHDGTKTNEFVPNTTEWELLDDLKIKSTDVFIDKYANDIFYKSKLQSKLNDLNIDELFITGCATDFCVESTVQSALTKDYNITVVEDGHTTGDRPHLKAEKVIEHYNWVWQNMIPTKGKIDVKNFEQIKNNLTSH